MCIIIRIGQEVVVVGPFWIECSIQREYYYTCKVLEGDTQPETKKKKRIRNKDIILGELPVGIFPVNGLIKPWEVEFFLVK